jgi:mannosyltransferase
MRSVKNKLILIIAILFIGLFLRVYDLSKESIWLDEGFSISYAALNLSRIFSADGSNPPLYYIILHWWVDLFGNSEFSVRFPSVIFGFFSIVMIYKLGNKIFNKDVGILSSLLLGISVFHIRYSQEARTYSLSVLLTLLSMYFFVRLLNKQNFRDLCGYALSSTLLIYSHIYGLFIIIAQNIYLISLVLFSKDDYRPDLKRWVLVQAVLMALFIPWVKISLTQILAGKSYSSIPMPSKLSIIDSFISYSGSQLMFLLFLTVSFFSVVGYEKINGTFNRKNFLRSLEHYSWEMHLLETDKITFLLLWLLTPVVLPFIISRFWTPIYSTRYTIMGSLAFYLLVARGISKMRHKHVKTIIITAIITFSFISLREYYVNINKEQWRDVAHFTDMNAKDEDLLLFNSGACQKLVFDYYSKRTDLTKKPFPRKGRLINEENIKELDPAVEGYKRVWVILSHSHDKKGLITSTLDESYDQLYHMSYIGINVFLFGKKIP